jgi:hypothetical protein
MRSPQPTGVLELLKPIAWFALECAFAGGMVFKRSFRLRAMVDCACGSVLAGTLICLGEP